MGIVNSLAGIVASLQVTEVLKMLLTAEFSLPKLSKKQKEKFQLGNQFIYLDLFSDFLFKKINITKRKDCSCQ